MKKMIFFCSLILMAMPLYAVTNTPGQAPINRPSQLIKKPSVRINLPPPQIQLPVCGNEGAYQCDFQNKRFRKCLRDRDGLWWNRWTNLNTEESDLADACSRDCVPGAIICPFRDRDYRICRDDGTWSEFRRLENNQDESDRVVAYCNSAQSRTQCYPGQYRCFNDGGYNRCGEEGYWSEAGTTSGQFTEYLNHCLFPRRH